MTTSGTPATARRRTRTRLAAAALTAALAAALAVSATPAFGPGRADAAEPAGEFLDTGWSTERDGQALVLELDTPDPRDRASLGWLPGATDGLPQGCTISVEAEVDDAWEPVAEATLVAGETGTRDITFPATMTDRVRLALGGCGETTLPSLLDQASINTPSQTRIPLSTTFDTDPAGASPYPWDLQLAEDASVAVETPDGADTSPAMLLGNPSTTATTSAWSYFPRTETVRIDYRFRVDADGAKSVVGLRDGQNQSIAAVGFSAGSIYAFGEQDRTTLAPYEPGRFYDISVTLTPGARSFDVAVDGQTVATALRTRTDTATVNNLTVVGFEGADATWIDDIVVTTTDTTAVERTVTGPFDSPPLPRIATLGEPAAAGSRSWSIGAETLDRDFADFSAYADDLAALGIPRARLQGGWARTEAVPGTYDWAWLDEAVDGLVDRGIEPWIELSYGNPAIDGGGTAGLGGKVPTGAGLQAWENWVAASVDRYGDRVSTWSVWNEPDLSSANTGTAYGELAALSARIVADQQPDAEIIVGNTTAVPATEFLREALTAIQDAGALDLIDVWGYHGYTENPDAQYNSVGTIRTEVDAFDPDIRLMQTENGAPSRYWGTFALDDYPWTEVSQAKWDLRRMLGDNGRGFATNVFTISDLRYSTPSTVSWNPKGLLQVDGQQQVARPKPVYRAVQATGTVFDASLALSPDALVSASADRDLSAYGYRDTATDAIAVSYWFRDTVPTDQPTKTDIDLVLPAGTPTDLVLVDLSDGQIYQVPDQRITSGQAGVHVRVPAYDAPLVLAQPSALDLPS